MSAAPARPLAGRSALVTGAGRGIGRGVAAALADAGAEVWLVARSAGDLEEVAADIRGRGGRAHACPCDVTDAAALKQTVAALPSLDVMVNNAGTNIPEPFVEVSEAHLDRLLELNVRAAFLAAQAAARRMLDSPDRKARGGAILNMSSQMGHVGAAGRTVYCMTKHALEGLTKAMAVELAPHGIRVNSVAPTFVETPMTRPMFERAEFRDWVYGRIPMGRLAQPQDVGAAVVFLASPAASLVTGTSLLVDGGWTAQ
ncbi:MAG: glucose 1-dehydrogenase [Burkholderiales bacterium]|nr:glucose 1-dehydrogenase [Burkholderiales bacterium]